MMPQTTDNPLRGSAMRLVLPTNLVGVVGGLLAVLYAVLTIQLPAGTEGTFSVIAVGAVAVATVTAFFWVRRSYTALRSASGTGRPPGPEVLRRVVAEVSGAGDRAFLTQLWAWGFGIALVVGPYGLLVEEATAAVLLRITMLVVLFGPLCAVFSYCFGALRAREVMVRVGEAGLSPEQIIEARPANARRLRMRLVIFTAVCVLTPAAITADLGWVFASRVVSELGAVSNVEVQERMAAEQQAGALPWIFLIAGTMVALTIASASLGGRALSGPMQDIAEEATRAASGKLGATRVIAAEDEVWGVATAFNGMQRHLADLLGDLQTAGTQIGVTTEQILATSGRYEAGAAEQASALNETSATTEELARSAAQIADNATQVATIADETLQAAREGKEGADTFMKSMDRMRQDNTSVASSVERLSQRVQQIGRIVELINGIADKSDLLALNAELEGTKAGEVGRGFSLVAAEMRRLAENVLESTREIEELIDEIKEATGAAVTATRGGLKATESGGALARQMTEALMEIVELAGETSEAVRSISLATQQQQSGTDQLAEAMADVLRVTQLSLAATKQVAVANTDLSSLADDLKKVVGGFAIEQEGRHG